MPENIEAWELWSVVQTQWRGAGLGIIGLDYLAVKEVAFVLEIQMTRPLLDKIRALEAAVMERLHNKSAEKQQRTTDH